MRRWVDRLTRSLARLVLRIFFREVQVLGVEKIPRDRPLLIVANHVNALVDPVLVLGSLPLHPRFLGKSTLWDLWYLRPLLALGGVVPVYRWKDPGVDVSKNVETFARSRQVLAQGGAIAIFPEGVSHSEPSLMPLRTGAARIALETEEEHGPLGFRIVPVGLTFDAKEMFRSRALVQVGEPIDPVHDKPEGGASEEEEWARVQALTAEIDRGIRAVTLNYASWEEAHLLEQAAEVFRRSQPELAARPGLAGRFPLRQAFVEAYPEMKRAHPDRVAAVARDVNAYSRLLRLFNLRDGQVVAGYPAREVVLFVLRSLGLILLRLPLAAVGTVLNWLPYRIPGWLSDRVAKTPDVRATYKLYSALFIFPMAWLLEAGLAGWLWGGWAAFATLVLAPIMGYIALLFFEGLGRFWDQARAYLVLRTQSRLAEALRLQRQAVYEGVAELVALYQEHTAGQTRSTAP